MIGDGRAPDAPPVDQLAESVCLTRMLLEPDLIDEHNLDPLLVTPAHRDIWRMMVRLRMRRPDLGCGEFYVEWLKEAGDLADLVFTADTEALRGWQDFEKAADAGAEVLPSDYYVRPFAWWLERLERINAARKAISAAQAMAERAWVEDLDGARNAATSALALTTPTPPAPRTWRATPSVSEALDV